MGTGYGTIPCNHTYDDLIVKDHKWYLNWTSCGT